MEKTCSELRIVEEIQYDLDVTYQEKAKAIIKKQMNLIVTLKGTYASLEKSGSEVLNQISILECNLSKMLLLTPKELVSKTEELDVVNNIFVEEPGEISGVRIPIQKR
jgi:AAA15 family ATPase/GTPase